MKDKYRSRKVVHLDLIGETVKDITKDINDSGNQCMIIHTFANDRYRIAHQRYCCERSTIRIVRGISSEIIGKKITGVNLYLYEDEWDMYSGEYQPSESLELSFDEGNSIKIHAAVVSTGCSTKRGLLINKESRYCVFEEE